MNKIEEFNQKLINSKNYMGISFVTLPHYKYFVNESEYNNLKDRIFAKHIVKTMNNNQYRIYSVENLSLTNKDLKGNYSNQITEPILYHIMNKESFNHIINIPEDIMPDELFTEMVAYSVMNNIKVSWSHKFDSTFLHHMFEQFFLESNKNINLILDNIMEFSGTKKIAFLGKFVTDIAREDKKFLSLLTMEQKRILLNELI